MRTTGNINFVLIGSRATGKTVYLASLFLNEKSVTSKDGHTIEYLQPLSDSLISGKYPQATAGTLHELKFNYKDENISCQIQIDDVDGYFVETMHKENKTTQKQRDKLIKNIKNSEGIIFFFPFEEKFNEESIKSFNYEIDTIIAKTTEMYSKYNHIPIPAVIAVAKWDNSPHFKTENEDEKVLEYIYNNQFLKLAKEKIKHHFPHLLITPISAIGKDIKQMNPYNLKKPLRFFIDETYRLWEKKINSLKDKEVELLKFLSRVHFDMKFYKDGKYNKEYDILEKKFTNEIFAKAKKLDTYSRFIVLQKKYANITPYLRQENRDKLEKIGKKLKSKQIRKKISWGTGILIIISILGVIVVGWYVKTELLKTEGELFSDLIIEFKHNNYKDAMEDVVEYQEKFKDTLNIEHKNRVEEIKNKIALDYNLKFKKILENTSLLQQYDELNTLTSEIEDFNTVMDVETVKNKYRNIKKLKDSYEKIIAFSIDDISSLDEISTMLNQLSSYKFKETISIKENFENSLITIANNLIDEKQIDNFDKVDNILKAFTTLNIDNKDIIKKLIYLKNQIQINNQYNELLKSVKDSSSYKDAILKVESDWKTEFSDEQANIINKRLNKRFNSQVEKILKKIPIVIGDFDDYNDLRKKIKRIEELKDNTLIKKIKYQPSFNGDNNIIYKEKSLISNSYSSTLNNGIRGIKITFGTNYEENEPLGFKCSSEGQIILEIGYTRYHYADDYGDCQGLEITWSSNQTFKVGKYYVNVIEEDLVDDDHYESSFELTPDNLIKMENNEYFQIRLNSNYYIGFGKG